MWAFSVRKQWTEQARLALSLIQSGRYDAAIGDETYDLAIALLGVDSSPTCPSFILYDFLGLDRMTMNPTEWIAVAVFNQAWGSDPRGHYQPVFLGEHEDIPLRRLGLFHAGRRAWAERHAAIVGHALQFDPSAYSNLPALRSRLGYGPEPLVLVSVGGTAVGSELLNLCVEAFPQARRDIPGLRMVLVCGPRLSMADRVLPEGVERKGYVPQLFEHFAACDLAIVQGGGASTIELTALKRPFLFFPLERHCEQLKHVAPRQERLGAGVRLRLKDTTPTDLSKQITATIGQEVSYSSIKIDGAQELARIVTQRMR